MDFDEFSNFMMSLLELKFSDFDADDSGVIDMNEINGFVDTLLGRVSVRSCSHRDALTHTSGSVAGKWHAQDTEWRYTQG